MATVAATHQGVLVEESIKSPAFQAYQVLHWGFTIVPIIAGVDKFFDKLTEWNMYLWAPLGRLFGSANTFMRIAGAIEILAGCLVAFKPKIGAPIVALWLVGIIVNLLLQQGNYDVALRDFGLFAGALALSRLAMHFDHPHAQAPSV